MPKLTDHALCDIELTHDEFYKLRLAVSREIAHLRENRELSKRLGLSSHIEDHLIFRYTTISDKLERSEKYWLHRGRFHVRFVEDRGCVDE